MGDDDNIVDLSEILRSRAAEQSRDSLIADSRDICEQAFLKLATKHNPPPDWAAEKAAIANEIVGGILQGTAYDFRLSATLPGSLDNDQHAALSAALQEQVGEWVKETTARMIMQSLDALGNRLLKLALPPR